MNIKYELGDRHDETILLTEQRSTPVKKKLVKYNDETESSRYS